MKFPFMHLYIAHHQSTYQSTYRSINIHCISISILDNMTYECDDCKDDDDVKDIIIEVGLYPPQYRTAILEMDR